MIDPKELAERASAMGFLAEGGHIEDRDDRARVREKVLARFAEWIGQVLEEQREEDQTEECYSWLTKDAHPLVAEAIRRAPLVTHFKVAANNIRELEAEKRRGVQR